MMFHDWVPVAKWWLWMKEGEKRMNKVFNGTNLSGVNMGLCTHEFVSGKSCQNIFFLSSPVSEWEDDWVEERYIYEGEAWSLITGITNHLPGRINSKTGQQQSATVSVAGVEHLILSHAWWCLTYLRLICVSLSAGKTKRAGRRVSWRDSWWAGELWVEVPLEMVLR